MTSLVAIDIETTGLDPERDAIIEIAAVKFNDRRIEGEWSSLINPGRAIPPLTSELTGITNAMVRQAPSIHDVIHELEAFAGNDPVIGHNIRFDLGFLQRYNILAHNEVIDTYEMAAVLLPTASRYNLGAIGQLLGILLPATHRAMDDTKLTHAVFMRLFEIASELPLDLIAEFVRHGEPLIDWDAQWVFQQILKNRYKDGIQVKRVRSTPNPELFELPQTRITPPAPIEQPVPLDIEETAAILEHGGPFSQYFSQYEQRPEQVEMLRAVTYALSESQHLLVEAGTGVGKSFAYLVPTALFAIQNNTRVVVSTNTINLQDQLISKDIPDLAAALNIPLRASVLKGRSNYLCPRRLDHLRRHGPNNPDEMRILAKVLVWLVQGGSGDRTQININRPAERDTWQRISAEDEACTGETCAKRTGGLCPFYVARQAAQTSHILVVNHALLLADVATGSKVLPEYQYVIIDEAHHLESATTNALSYRLSQFDLERMMREIGNAGAGALGRLLLETKNSLRPSDFGLLQQKVERATDQTIRFQNLARDFFSVTRDFIDHQRENRPPSNYAYQERILPSTRTLPGWDEVEASWDAAGETLRLLTKTLEEIYKASAELYAEGFETLEDINSELSQIYRRLAETETNISSLIADPSQALVYWIEIHPNYNNRLTFNAAPLHVGGLIEKYLWHAKNSVILTSATMTTQNGFDYITNTLSAYDAETLMLGSPFDYEASTLLYIPTDIPEPNDRNFQPALDRNLIELCSLTGGRTLVLFTSYAQLKRTSANITAPLARNGITVFEQGQGASANALLETFKSTDQAVLLGTRSFWEGVDIPGHALSVVVITKLPFDVPSDPLIAARSELYEDSFFEYYLPEAILKFRQGFGRLIRTQHDRGVVAILDKRVLTKRYGRAFIDSLPQCTSRQGTLANLPKLAGKWLGL